MGDLLLSWLRRLLGVRERLTKPPQLSDEQMEQLRSYLPPRAWKKAGRLRAKAEGGAVAWLNVMGLVGLERPDGFYVTLGLSFADDGGEPYGRNYGPPPRSRPLRVHPERQLWWSLSGYPTDAFVAEENADLFYESLVEALNVMGYKVHRS